MRFSNQIVKQDWFIYCEVDLGNVYMIQFTSVNGFLLSLWVWIKCWLTNSHWAVPHSINVPLIKMHHGVWVEEMPQMLSAGWCCHGNTLNASAKHWNWLPWRAAILPGEALELQALVLTTVQHWVLIKGRHTKWASLRSKLHFAYKTHFSQMKFWHCAEMAYECNFPQVLF